MCSRRLVDRRGRGIKHDHRAPHRAVEPLIGERYAIAPDRDWQCPAALLAHMPAHLEDIRKVGFEAETQLDVMRPAVEVV